MDLWPVEGLPPTTWQWSIEGSYASGGQPMTGPPQDSDASCGGWWRASLDLSLMGAEDVRALRAALVAALSSSPMFVVPCLDGLNPFPAPWGRFGAPAPRVPSRCLPTTFSSAALTDNVLIKASLAAAAYMPAYPAPAAPPTQAQIQMTAGRALRGGEYFTLIGTSGEPRMHQIGRILSAASGVFTVSFLPPLRENYAEGTQVLFDKPACTMKLDKSSLRDAWPKLSAGMTSKVTIAFAETGQGPTS